MGPARRMAVERRRALALVVGLLVCVLAEPPSIASAVPSPAAGDQLFAAIDADVNTMMNETGMPGMSLGIVKNDAIVHLRGFGEADETGRAVTPQTPFAIGSMTKSFTALAIMQLVEAGHVDLNAPVQLYLPWFQFADPVASSRITVSQLLNQTSGIPSINTYTNRPDDSATALEGAVQSFRSIQLDRAPGSSFEYANANFTTLGLIVATVSGQSYEQYVADHVLSPLGMSNSYMSVPQAQQHGRAAEHRFWFGRPSSGGGLPYNRATTPAGLMSSDAADMSRYLLVQLAEGRYPGGQILSKSGIAQLHRGTADLGGGDFYAMGWVDSIGPDGQRFSWHNGDTQGSQSYMGVLPSSGWAMVLLANGSNDLRPTDVDAIAQRVLARLLGAEPMALLGLAGETYEIILVLTLAVTGLQGAGIIRSVVLLRRWRALPARRPRGAVRVGARVVAPAALNLLWGVTCLVVLPAALGQSLWVAVVDEPSDIGVTVAASGMLALLWGAIIRPVLAATALRSTEHSG